MTSFSCLSVQNVVSFTEADEAILHCTTVSAPRGLHEIRSLDVYVSAGRGQSYTVYTIYYVAGVASTPHPPLNLISSFSFSFRLRLA